MGKEKGSDRKELNWFLQLFTIGDRFSVRDFYDRLKKGFVEFLIVFFGVLVSFSVEQQGENFDDRGANIDNLSGLRDELMQMREYTQEYVAQNEWVTDMYLQQYRRWEEDNDSIFLVYEEEDDFYYPPMAFYTNRDPFNPPRVVYDAIKLDGTFRFLGSDIGRLVNDNYDGTDLKYLMINTDKEEKTFVDEYRSRLATQWVFDIENIEVEDNSFWVENRKYVQQDRFVKYNLFKRLELWNQINEQLLSYDETLAENIKILDSVLLEKERQWTLIWWWGETPSWLQSSPKLATEEPQDQEPLVDQ
ncbi:hypothetical protein N9575_01865 [Flavobacteriaceae bacterium]|nr:hypothetical protein [Flavobacteriaceae bacterium]MDA9245011.1 hypothetical protein [Flavobacteriaceae bacterium]MDA9984537.1 hypothetical protein [Flavobacteriaceae bacterium]MDB4112842.1 hypothetical protein [Flavobacteriaceae bacterium]MDB4118270.1 hypothetical protein [Flavobacteriaceae bacterium]